MNDKFNQILNELKNSSINFSKYKDTLSDMMKDSNLHIRAKALMALIYNENSIKTCENLNTSNNKLTIIINATFINAFKEPTQENLLIYKDKIIGTGLDLPDFIPETADSLEIIEATGLTITSGLIDQHIHGGFGCNFNTATEDEMLSFSEKLAQFGVTSILPTLMTDSQDKLKTQIQRISNAKNKLKSNNTKFLGIHLEGPYLNAKFKGIHPENLILDPQIDNFKRIEHPEIKIVTYAPEKDQNFEFTKYLAEKNIIASAGHSDAKDFEIKKATDYGLKQITHIFNAMTPLHHRNAGIIGEALTNNDLYVEVISDGLHLNTKIIDIILRAKPDSKILFISDSLPLNSSTKAFEVFGGQKIYKKENKAVNSDNTFAGSLIFLNDAINNLLIWNLSNFSKAIGYSSFNISRNINMKNLGFIAKNQTADLVFWSNNGHSKVVRTIINGENAYVR